ncbi:MAG: MerR family transcriptional regulator [bacterium]
MRRFSVKQLAGLAGVSVRTLHHYDHIGLLKPAYRSEKGYRYYGRMELFKLQQILFFKELDFPLKEICEIMNNPSFDLLEAMEFHREQLIRRAERLKKLLQTINKTIDKLRNKKETELTEKEIYAGFSEEEVKSIRREVSERWGEKQLLQTEERIRTLGKQGLGEAKKKGEEACQLLADLMHLHPSDRRVQKAVALYHKYLNTFYDVSETRYRGLAKMYVEDSRFTAYFEKTRAGLANFVNKAIQVYCDNGMKVM